MARRRDGQKSTKPQLRAEAERRLAHAAPLDSELGPEELVHELRVHQIELEMQNESLRQSQLAMEESRDRYVDLYEYAPVGYCTLAANGQIAGVNLTGATLLGVERKRLRQHRFDLYVTPQDRECWRRLFVTAMGTRTHQRCELDLQRGDGSVLPVSVDCVRMDNGADAPMLRVTLADISDRRRAEEELRIAAVAFESDQGTIVTDPNGVVVRVNQAFTRLTGHSPAEVIGRPATLLKSARQDTAFYQRIRDALKQQKYWQGEIWNRRKSGEIYAAWLTITAVCGPDGEVSHYVGTFSDITPNKEAEAEIHRMAFFDPLTKLPNRRLLYDRVGQAMATSSRNRRYGALLFVDLDNFKNLNDTRGHDAGDQWLIEVARRLQAGVRAGDTVARLGGDEFVVMLEGLSSEPRPAAIQAGLVCETLRESIARPYDVGGLEYSGASSIGVGLFQNHEVTIDELLKRIDMAMYQAKSVGRNAVRFFDPAMQTALDERGAFEAELRLALVREQLHLYYQVQVDGMGRVSGAEALLRWEHPQRGLTLPAEFIRLAEDTGLILPIGRWVLESACAQLKAWQAVPDMRAIPLAINLGVRQLRQPGFVDEVRVGLSDAGIDPGRLTLELTERAVLDDLDDTIDKMRALKTIGVGLAIDDFGTGYSSLTCLRRLPLDQLKIDGSIVSHVADDAGSAAAVEALNFLGRSLGLEVIAEGVETEAQLERLRQYGCTAFQGFLFSRPLALAGFEAFVRNNGATR